MNWQENLNLAIKDTERQTIKNSKNNYLICLRALHTKKACVSDAG
jgi:hypothetical protein